MSYVIPNSTIELFYNVNLSGDKEQSIYFDSVAEQNTFYSNLPHKTLGAVTNPDGMYSYVRKDGKTIKANVPYAELMKYSYLRFKNTSHENKWFYAYIDEVKYVSETVTEITFTIDVMQTWLENTDYTLGTCLIEREHSETDEVGDNTVEEGLDLGETVYDDIAIRMARDVTGNNSPLTYVAVCCTGSSDFWSSNSFSRKYDGSTQGYAILIFDASYVRDVGGKEQFEKLLSDFTNPENIIAIYDVPRDLAPIANCDEVHINLSGFDIDCYALKDTSSVHGYWNLPSGISGKIGKHTVVNKKLYTFPYNYLKVCNYKGDSRAYQYERFTDSDGNINGVPQFKIFGSITPPTKSILRPANYKGCLLHKYSTYDDFDNVIEDEAIEGSWYVPAGWNNDTFKAWLSNQLPASIVSTVGGGAVAGGGALANATLGISAINPAVAAGVAVASGALATLASGLKQHATDRSERHGGASSDNCDIGNNNQRFQALRAHIDEYHLEVIDQYFHLYGYRCLKHKVPNTHVRRKWTFVKTVDCKIMSNRIPTDDKKAIEAIYNNGVRLFKGINPLEDISLITVNAPL